MTTIYYPDISHHNAPLTIQPKTVIVVAKVTEGTDFYDDAYAGFKSQAAQQGSVFVAYHWLHPGNAQAQAKWCHDHAGSTPLMIDAENVEGGYLKISDITNFVSAYRGLGGIVNLVYLPKWYWSEHMGSPSLTPLSSMGLRLVSSNYTHYSDDGPGWAPYGGVTPYCWQYTDGLSYGGKNVDFNACKDTVEGFAKVVGATVAAPKPTPPATNGKDFSLAHWGVVSNGSKGDAVKVAQGLLLAHGYSVGSRNGLPDGDFGPTTEASTKKLQAAYKISQDGRFGPQTLSVALYGKDYS